MNSHLVKTKHILQQLVAFPVMSGETNLTLIDYIVELLNEYGVQCELVFSEDNTRANLFATIGPKIHGGVMLSGHTDVVHVTGQNWTTTPFDLVEKNTRLYGRGSVDMKGFLACCLASVPIWLEQDLKRPIQLGFTYDEETGCYGANRLSEWLKNNPLKPDQAIIGEPTGMKIIAGHKGGSEITTRITGIEAHSSRPDSGISAIHYATKMINFILQKAEELKQNTYSSSIFNPPYSTLNVGTIEGGSSRNTIAGYCEFEWETRTIPDDNEQQILDQIENYCQTVLLPEMQVKFPQAQIHTDIKALVPGLPINKDSKTIAMIKAITTDQNYGVVSFGTDAGYFSDAGIDCVVYGPGSIDQAHKPNEYIEISELEKCLLFLTRLGEFLQ